jgi:uncharacterized protein with von Willebrand factor type A (vWA) domain
MLDVMDTRLLDALHQKSRVQNKPTTVAILLLDASSSMRRFGGMPFTATNDCIESLKELPETDNNFAGVWSFSSHIKSLVPMQPVSNMQNLQEYSTHRGTVLYRVVAEAIEAAFKLALICKHLKKSHVDIDISLITDGYDSMSKDFHEHELILAEQARKEGIGLHAIGIGMNHQKLAKRLGFDPNLAHNVQATEEGVVEATSITRIIFTETISGIRPKKP